MHVTKLVQITALLAVGAQASSSSAPASQDSTLEARAPDGYSRPADLFKFNWHIPKIPTWKELQEPADRYKHLQPAKPAANQPAKSPSKKAGRRSLENDEEPEQEERVEVKRAVAWSACLGPIPRVIFLLLGPQDLYPFREWSGASCVWEPVVTFAAPWCLKF